MAHTNTTPTIAESAIAMYDSPLPLYWHYDGQTSPQPARIWIDCRDGRYGVEVVHADATPMDVYHGHIQTAGLTNMMSGADVRDVLTAIAPLVARVCAGYTAAWDGDPSVGGLSGDAASALHDIERVADAVEPSTSVYTMDEWLRESTQWIDERLRAQSPARVAHEVLAGATADGHILVHRGIATADDIAEWIRAYMYEDVRYYRASDGGASEDYDARSMDEAERMARESWESAEPGTYEVVIEEYESEEDRDAPVKRSSDRTAVRVITVEAV